MTPTPELETNLLGGVDIPSAEDLLAMRESNYILRARGGKLTRVEAEKHLLPHDPQANPQAIEAALSPEGIVYVRLASIMCRSADGGRTWDACPLSDRIDSFQVLSDGTLVAAGVLDGVERGDCVTFVSSTDGGRTWRKISEIAHRAGHTGGVYAIHRLPDDTLVCGISASNVIMEEDKYVSGEADVHVYRSADGGATWEGPTGRICTWGSEGNIARTPSGRLLAIIRHQRPFLPLDPPDFIEEFRGRGAIGGPYKNVFLVDSTDDGRTWHNFRQLTTVFGQTRGHGAALSDGTVVVVHDTRYGPGSPGSRGMISRDEGQTWEDEVYYLDRTSFTGSYNATLAIEDDLLLTIGGWSDAGNGWDLVLDNTHFTAIRWRPVLH